MKMLCAVLLVSAIASPILAEDAVEVPKGVVYKQATEAVNKAAVARIEKAFAKDAKPEDFRALFGDALTCGPGLWTKLKGDPAAGPDEVSNKTTFHIPNLGAKPGEPKATDLTGRLYKNADGVKAFCAAFRKAIKVREDFKVRKLNPDELKIYWAMIPFDIEEPLFLVESGKLKILLQFMKTDVMWVDDLGYFAVSGPGEDAKKS